MLALMAMGAAHQNSKIKSGNMHPVGHDRPVQVDKKKCIGVKRLNVRKRERDTDTNTQKAAKINVLGLITRHFTVLF